MAENGESNALSSFNLTEIASEEGLLKTILRLHDVCRMGCVPAIVVSYDYETKIARVKPLVKHLKATDNGLEGFDRPMYDVPVYSMSQGAFRVDYPLFSGNTGMLFAVDRSWDTAKEKNSAHLSTEEDQENGESNKNKGAQDPDSLALADFTNGFFLPMGFGGGSEDDKGKIAISRIKDSESTGGNIPEIRLEISDNGIVAEFNDDKITFNGNGLIYEGESGEDISLMDDIRYDISSHQIQKKTRPAKKFGNFIVGVGEQSGWTMVEGGQAEKLSTT